MTDAVEVSYTGDILAHRRCPRAWCYEKHTGFHPYEQIQAMEGRLVHHAMEWLTRQFWDNERRHATRPLLEKQLTHYFRVLWARGVKTAFSKKKDVIDRVLDNLFPLGHIHPTVKAAVEGAKHTEYELRSVRRLQQPLSTGKKRVLLTGVLDLVVQQQQPLTYRREWRWSDEPTLLGSVGPATVNATCGDLEIWDYKASRADTSFLNDYVRQLVTYAALYRERSGEIPKRCVLYFVNEPPETSEAQLIAIPITNAILTSALDWTVSQVVQIQNTILEFRESPVSVSGGLLEAKELPVDRRVTPELKAQCTACGHRFGCEAYAAALGDRSHPDINLRNIAKN